MSEAITKAPHEGVEPTEVVRQVVTRKCGRCDGTGRDECGLTPPCSECAAICPDCSGTGRIPDIESTQRAQLDAARIMCERFESALRGKESENAELRSKLDEANFERSTLRGGCDSLGNRLTAAKAEIARLTAEVERLKGTVVWQRGRIPTPDLGPYDDRDDAAEHERYLVVFSDGCLDIGPLADFRAERQLPDVVAWARVGMPDAAWLAGCKS